MLIAYVDESYDRDAYFIGAAVASFSAWESVSARLADIRCLTAAVHGTPAAVEFHAHELMGGTGAWHPLRGRHREAAGVSLAVLRAAADADVRYLFRGVDVPRLRSRAGPSSNAHAVVLRHLLEELDRHVGAVRPGEQAIVVADEIATQAEHQRAFAGYQQFEAAGVASLPHLSVPMNFASSAHCDGLQVVDLAVYLHHRRERVHNPHPAAQRTLERQWARVEPRIVHRGFWQP